MHWRRSASPICRCRRRPSGYGGRSIRGGASSDARFGGMPTRRAFSLLLVTPALTVVLALFVYPLGYSLASAFTTRDGEPSLDNFIKTFDLYTTDIVFTLVITTVSTALVGVFAAA